MSGGVVHAVWAVPLDADNHDIVLLDERERRPCALIEPAAAAHLVSDLMHTLADLDATEVVAGLRALADEIETAERARSN